MDRSAEQSLPSPHEIDRADRHRGEAEDEHDDGQGAEDHAGGADGQVLFADRRLIEAETVGHEHQQHSPHGPAVGHEDGERQQDQDGGDGHVARDTAEQGVHDVSAVELACREEVERRRQQPEPRRKAHRMHDEERLVGQGAEEGLLQERQQQRVAEFDAPLSATACGSLTT